MTILYLLSKVTSDVEPTSSLSAAYFSAFLFFRGPAFLNNTMINKLAGTTINAAVIPIFNCGNENRKGPTLIVSTFGLSPKIKLQFQASYNNV